MKKIRGKENGWAFVKDGMFTFWFVNGQSCLNFSYSTVERDGLHHTYIFAAIENALGKRGVIQSHILYHKHQKRSLDDQIESLNKTTGKKWKIKADLGELFEKHLQIYWDDDENLDTRRLGKPQYELERGFHVCTMSRYVCKVIDNFRNLFRVDNKTDPLCVQALNTTVYKNVISFVPKYVYYYASGPCYKFEIKNGELVIIISKYNCNMSEMFSSEHTAFDFKIIVEPLGIPVCSYRTLIEVANPLQKKLEKKIKDLTGHEWSLKVDFKKTYTEMIESYRNYASFSSIKNFPEVLVQYFEKIITYLDQLIKLYDNSVQKGPKLPFKISELFEKTFHSHTILVDFSLKFKTLVENCHWCELKDGMLIIRVNSISNTHTVGRTRKTGILTLMKFEGKTVREIIEDKFWARSNDKNLLF